MAGPCAEFYEREHKGVVQSPHYWPIMLNTLREHIDRFHRLMSIVHDYNPKSVLDVGCQWGIVGALIRWQRNQHERVIHGVDLSMTSCRHAKEIMGYDEVFCGDVREMQLPRTYELVLCTELLEHVEDSEAVVRKVASLTEKYALFSVPIEEGEVDGVVHVKHVRSDDLLGWVSEFFGEYELDIIPSEFGEKPHWQGWYFCVAHKE